MSKSDAFELQLLDLIFNGTAITGLADNAGTSPLTNLYVALHSADPADAGDQSTSEVAYTGYARVAVARTSAGWTVTQSGGVTTCNPTANIDFPACTGGSATATYFSIGTAATGTGEILYSGALSPSISISSGTTPRLDTATAITED